MIWGSQTAQTKPGTLLAQEDQMLKSMIGLRSFLGIFFILIVSSVAQAQAARTWVSGVGDDVNPCSRTAPCKTFAGALAHTNTGGEIDCLDSGGFGSATISKSVTLDGTGCQAGIIASGVNGININITSAADTAKSVRIRHISINGTGSGKSGIRVTSARSVFLDHVLIDGFDDHGLRVETDRTEVFVSDTTIRHIGKSGINIVPTGINPRITLFVERTSLMGTFTGLSVSKGGRATIRDSSLSQNRNGLVSETAELNVINCVLTENETAVTARDGATIRLAEVVIVNNRTGLLNVGGKILAFNHVLISGNDTDGVPSATIPTP